MRFLRKNLLALLALAVLSLIGAQTYVGEHGLQARSALKTRISGLKKQLDILQAKHRRIETRVRLLSPQKIDRDLLEEVARQQLNFVHEKESIYIHNDR